MRITLSLVAGCARYPRRYHVSDFLDTAGYISIAPGGDEGPTDDIEDGKMTCLADVAQLARALAS
jgi:hypothetical protein